LGLKFYYIIPNKCLSDTYHIFAYINLTLNFLFLFYFNSDS